MAVYNIDEKEIAEMMDPIQRVANGAVIELIDQAAAVLLPLQGTNQLVDDAIEQCKAFQDLYNNGMLVTLDDWMKESNKIEAIANWMKTKANIGSVSKTSTAVETGKIDADAVMV